MTDHKLSARWRTEAGEALSAEVVARLLAGKSLSGLDLGQHDGRTDLRGLLVPQPHRLRRYEREGWFLEELSDRVHFKKAELVSLDLSGALLDNLRFWDCNIDNCRFDRARCQHFGLLRTEVVDCSFVGADLRQAALGAWSDGGNVYRPRVVCRGGLPRRFMSGRDRSSTATFRDPDWRKSISNPPVSCGADLLATFETSCSTTGDSTPPSPTRIRWRASISWMQHFTTSSSVGSTWTGSSSRTGLTISSCIGTGACSDRALAELRDDGSPQARVLRATLEHRLHWSGPHQQVGVFSMLDLDRRGRAALVDRASELLRRCENDCAAC